MSIQVWKHPTRDVIRIQWDEDLIEEIPESGSLGATSEENVPGDWTELTAGCCDCPHEMES